MKHRYLPAIFISCFAILFALTNQSNAGTNDCDSVNEELSSQFRFLGDWRQDGKPNYLENLADQVSPGLIDFVINTLPEHMNLPNSSDEYFGNNVQLNTELTERSKVFLTMVHEGANWKNTLGYYTYDISNPPQTVYDIDSMVVLFPNVSQPHVINHGDKILLGEFPENTGIGYFLIAKGWVGDTICFDSHIIFSDPHLNTFTSPEYQQQTILLNFQREEKLLLCFEDMKRPGGDNDFNDAVFYITAAPGAIDTTDIPKVPTAHLSGDTTLCNENDPASIKVELEGQAPWTIIYNNGIRNITINGIEDATYTFNTMIKDTIKLVSVRDKNKLGIATGEAIVQVSAPVAFIREDQAICGGNDDSGFVVNLEGKAPFSMTYRVGEEEMTVESITENQFEITGTVGKEIELISMSDNYCAGEIAGGVVTIQNFENPELAINGNGSICGDATMTSFDLSLSGEGPWVMEYTLNGQDFETPIQTDETSLDIYDKGELVINSIKDENCYVSMNSTYTISNQALPTAVISDYSNLCGEDKASVSIDLSGSGPWTVYYEINDVEMETSSDEELMILSVVESGSFELIGVSDANCENDSEGIIDLELADLPSATISGDTVLCEGGVATVEIKMTGIAPFTVVYSDGSTETEVISENNTIEFDTQEFATYSLLSVDDAYCSGVVNGSATISDGSEDIQVEIDALENSCFGEDIELNLLGDTDGISILWTTEGQGLFSNTDQISTVYSPAEDEYGAVVFYAEVNNSCMTKTISEEVTIIEELDTSFNISPSDDLLTNSQITFTPENDDYDEYFWEFGDDNTSQATMATHEYIEGNTYEVKLTITLAGCTGEGSQEIDVLAGDELYIPNAFSPDAQNPENQVVKVYGNNVDEVGFSFRIINRWGKTMYHTKSFAEANTVGWKGINRNNSEELEMNVFTYIVKGQFLDGDEFEKTGTITQVK